MSAQMREVPASDQAEQIAALKALTGEIRERMLARDWATAAELDVRRRAGIGELFEHRARADDLPALVEGLRELVRMNDELLGLMAHQRRMLDRQADTLRSGRQMSSAYLGGNRRRR